MISRLGLLISRWFRWLIPDPFVIAIVLTVVTIIAALLFGQVEVPTAAKGEPQPGRWDVIIDSWGDLFQDSKSRTGIWKLLTFSMQMCLVLLTGHVLAATRPVRWCIDRVASIPTGTASAAAFVGVLAAATGLVNWGLGLIVGALLARDVGRSLESRGIRAHYPLIAAAGYMGLLTWHGGFSGSAPLTMTSEKGVSMLPEQYAREVGPIPLEETILSPMNLVISLGLLVLIPCFLALLAPRNDADLRTFEEFKPIEEQPFEPDRGVGLPRWLNGCWIISWALAGLLLYTVFRFIEIKGVGSIGLDAVIMIMFSLGLVLHGSPVAYMHAAGDAARGCAGIIVQFPLYAGIMGLMYMAGLDRMITEFFVSIGNATTMPALSFISAGIVNVFVPSGGGQWAIQGPIALQSGMDVGIEPGKMVMAVAYGDELTNMLQPFWALPLLAITGVRARDIVGYTALVMVVAGCWMGGWLLLWN